MKIVHTLSLVCACAAVLAFAGCEKKDDAANPSSTSQPSGDKMNDMADDAKDAMDDAGEAAKKKVDEATDAAKDAMDDATGG